MVSSAVHPEVADSLETDACINALPCPEGQYQHHGGGKRTEGGFC